MVACAHFYGLRAPAAAGGEAAAETLFGWEYVQSELLRGQTGISLLTAPVMLGDTAYLCLDNGALYGWTYGEQGARKAGTLPPQPEFIRFGTVSYDDMSKEQAAQADACFHLLAPGADALYAVNLATGRLGVIAQGALRWLDIRFDASQTLADGWLRMTHAAFCAGDTLYIPTLYDEEAGGLYWNYSVVAVDLLTGATKRLKTKGAQEVCAYKDNALLLLRVDEQEQYRLTALDVSSGALSDLPYALPNMDGGANTLSALAYDGARDAIYYADGGGVYRAEKGKIDRVAPHAFGYIYEGVRGWVLPGGQYALGLDGVQVMDLDAAAAGETLVLSLRGMKDEGMYNAFAAAHPEVTLDIRYEELTSADIGLRVQTGDAETDVFQVFVDSSFRALADKGYAAVIGDHAQIMSDAQTLYPAVYGALQNSAGALVAYPQGLQINLWDVNPALWKTYFGDEALPGTYAELFEAMLRFQAGDGPEDGALFLQEWDYEWLVRKVIGDYMVQRDTGDMPIDFNTPELRAALEALARVNDWMLAHGITYYFEGDLYPESEVLNRAIFYTGGGGNAVLTRSCGVEGYKTEELLPFVFKADETPVLRGYLSVLMVNPLSKHQELAREYIAAVTRMDTDAVRYYLLHPEASQPVEREDFAEKLAGYVRRAEDLRARIAAVQETGDQARLDDLQYELGWVQRYVDEPELFRWRITGQGIAAWRRLAPAVCFFETSRYLSLQGGPAQEQVNKLCAQYAAGQSDISALLARLTEVMDMIWKEQR